ncbi:hypothetical protein EBL89_06740 [Cereibacter sphaeroides]|uniref:hypothetical protein n=1 Tax=Cereibacter sphaeroides TaxID=1063 RepID=UPI000F523CF8|nr:hypothetical protein [Cereibacter sphaeroides]AZB55022.1 hypothetical protein EBL89_06740 [Cereibacter sphaeroides]AZB59278.1 hypothetical protein EBL88_06680 [Cereibacter sphaeroides]
MPAFAVFEHDTGRILRTGSCPDEYLDMQAAEGEAVFVTDGMLDDERHYIRNWRPALYPPKPGPWAVFDFETGLWFDPRTSGDLAAELAAARSRAVERVNEGAGALRRQFVTPIPGQEMLYLRKEQEARAFVADPEPNPERYPLIAAETGITAPTAWEIAQLWLNMADLWIAVAGPLEAARMTATNAIGAAASSAEIDAILASFNESVAALAALTA